MTTYTINISNEQGVSLEHFEVRARTLKGTQRQAAREAGLYTNGRYLKIMIEQDGELLAYRRDGFWTIN